MTDEPGTAAVDAASSPTSGRSAASTTARRRTARCCSRFADEHGVGRLDQLTPALLDDFLASRPRPRPRSFNHLARRRRLLPRLGRHPGAAGGLTAARTRRRRDTDRRCPFLFDPAQARRLLDAAAALPDNPRATGARPDLPRHLRPLLRTRAASRRGLRTAPRRRRHRADSSSSCGAASSARAASSRTGRASPSCSPTRSSAAPSRGCRARRAAVQLRRPALRAPGHGQPGRSTAWSPTSTSRSPTGVSPPRLHCLRHSFAVGCLLRWYREGVDPSATALPAVDVHGPRRPGLDRGLPDDHPGAARRGQPAVRGLRRAGLGGGGAMTGPQPLGPLMHSFFVDHLVTVKGLRPASVRSYRDTIRLLLCFVAERQGHQDHQARRSSDLTFERVLGFLRYLEARSRQPRPHPQPAARRPAHPVRLHRQPGTGDARRLPAGRSHPHEAGGTGRDPLPRTRRDRGTARGTCPATAASPCGTAPCCCSSTTPGPGSRRSPISGPDTSTSASTRLVRLHGKGDKWRTCPLWQQTAQLLTALLDSAGAPPAADAPVFCSRNRAAAHPLRHLQDRAAPRRAPRRPPHRPQRSARTSSATPPPSTSSKPASRST